MPIIGKAAHVGADFRESIHSGELVEKGLVQIGHWLQAILFRVTDVTAPAHSPAPAVH
jgi:hypothetical protein